MAGDGEGEKGVPPQFDLDAKWDACLDITLRRFVYSSFAGACSALLLFRSPTTRWAAIAFGAGVGLGSAYSDCSRIFSGSLPKWPLPPNVSSPSSSSSSKDGMQ
uniref:MICOS complex subunit MIC10 n=1 Tax=Araucaria cunninghamii TaxID=56994 RepID=A0A0D6QZN6_ARACU